ncbi:30S ribosomal protein S19e [Candidatus Woesearchaeota archaeon]|nr:30S ribosomal protein S19e [Candidatus Woesearchaeota archaeon]
MGIHDVYPNDLIEKAAEELKKIDSIKPPAWAGFVKTGVHKERAPVERDWWYKRAAAVLRTVQILGPIGVSKLRAKYGGKQRRGHQPPVFKKGGGSIIRKVLQQLDKAGFTKFAEKGLHKGRIITKEGKLFLNKVAESLAKEKPVKQEVKVEAKPEATTKDKVSQEKPVPAVSKEEVKEAGKKKIEEKEETKPEGK